MKRVFDIFLGCLAALILLVPVLLLSAVFYYFIERPFMDGKWTDMLMRKKKDQ